MLFDLDISEAGKHPRIIVVSVEELKREVLQLIWRQGARANTRRHQARNKRQRHR